MAVRKLKPTTPSQRFRVMNSFQEVTADNKPLKSLTKGKSKSGGRNNTGKMTMRYTGGGHKRKLREIDFKRNKDNVPAKVASIEYDPNRTARIALLHYADGEKRYIIAPTGLEVGAEVMSGEKATPNIGNCMPLKDIPMGSVVSCVEMRPGQGAILARSAGAYAQLVARDGKYAVLKMPSSEVRLVLTECRATIGSVSNSDHALEVSGKAGRKRWLGRRPRTRGVAMNPVDHPMGGGEGRSSGGHPRSRNGVPAKGYKTRSKKNATNRFIVERRKK
ncbi:MAG: 50S ribosomal protein L2 [Cryomorphaceae bacterium]|nr:50S ribosomal protein L2 [Cryomorphaceae bacterium]